MVSHQKAPNIENFCFNWKESDLYLLKDSPIRSLSKLLLLLANVEKLSKQDEWFQNKCLNNAIIGSIAVITLKFVNNATT